MIRFIGGPNDGDFLKLDEGETMEDGSIFSVKMPPQVVVKDASDAPPTLDEIKAAAERTFDYRVYLDDTDASGLSGILVPSNWDPDQAIMHVLEHWGPANA